MWNVLFFNSQSSLLQDSMKEPSDQNSSSSGNSFPVRVVWGILFIILLLVSLVNAQIAIKSFRSIPEKVLPGERLRLSIILENVGSNKTEDILVKLDLDKLPFAPLVSSSEQVIDEIKKDNEKEVFFDLVALPNADAQIYKVPVEISYSQIKKTSLISLEVNSKVNLDLILDSSELIKINDKGKVILKFVNNGLSQIKFIPPDSGKME